VVRASLPLRVIHSIIAVSYARLREFALLIRPWKMDEKILLERVTVNPRIFGGKPIIRGRRLAVEHVLASGSTSQDLLAGYPWLEPEDIRACLIYASRPVSPSSI
jgi:uncharacterized protein (DUF433 family)